MTILNNDIVKLQDRIKTFLEVNHSVDIIRLKLHLETRETDLLLAVGYLLQSNLINICRDGSDLIIEKK